MALTGIEKRVMSSSMRADIGPLRLEDEYIMTRLIWWCSIIVQGASRTFDDVGHFGIQEAQTNFAGLWPWAF